MKPDTSTIEFTVLPREAQSALAEVGEDGQHQLTEAFSGFFARAQGWRDEALAIVVTSADQTEEVARARSLRLDLKGVRVEAEKTRKRLKEDSLRRGKAIDGVYNVLEFLIKPLEDHLLAQEQFAARLAEAERQKRGATRAAELAGIFPEASFSADLLADMGDEEYAVLLDGVRARAAARAEELRLAEEIRLEAARAAEEARLAEIRAAEEAKVAAEAEAARLREEAAAAKAAAEAERVEREAREAAERAERERLAEIARIEVERRESVLRAEREAAEARAAQERKAAEEAQRIAREIEQKLVDERAALAKAEAERVAALEAAAAEEIAREEALRAAPDKARLAVVLETLHGIPLPEMKSAKGKKVKVSLAKHLSDVTGWLESQIASL